MMKNLLLILTLCCGLASAEVYKWTDENGKLHYSDKPPPGQSTQKLAVKINSYVQTSHQTIKSSQISSHSKVIMYSTSWCGYCKKARNHFAANNIAFIEYDIEENKRAKREYDALGGKGVPVILYGDQRMNGFSVAGFEQIYKH